MDTVFREQLFEWLLEIQFNMTIEEYYNSKIANDFFNNHITQKLDFRKFNNGENA